MSEITVDELKQLLGDGDPVSIVDIREAPEFEAWHIQGSTNVPVYEALRVGRYDGLSTGAAALPTDRPVVAVCKAGIVSRRAVEWLRGNSFTAASLVGGMRGWGSVWSEAPVRHPDLDAVRLIQVRRNGKGCLSYLLANDGRAIVVDPSVDASAYVEIAEREGLRIERVLETHVHADHLSRARELCRAVGARLVMPPNRRVSFGYDPLADGERIDVGGVVVEAIATPGHTMESTSYLVADRVLLTGDTLFVDSVGRPDLERGDAGAEAGARALYRSLHDRLLRRADHESICPAHHASAIGFDGVSVQGELRSVAHGQPLLSVDEETFVSTVLRALPAKPPNHASIIAVNEGRSDASGIDPLDLEAGPNRCACA